MSSINRILRNRAAERAAAEFARAAGYGLYPPPHHPYGGFGWPPTHMWPPSAAAAATNMSGITSPGSTSSHALSPASACGSHETPGSPDANRLIGEWVSLGKGLYYTLMGGKGY